MSVAFCSTVARTWIVSSLRVGFRRIALHINRSPLHKNHPPARVVGPLECKADQEATSQRDSETISASMIESDG
jgi:hypothetical protein